MNDIVATFYAIINGEVTPIHIFVQQPYQENNHWHTRFELRFGDELIRSMSTYRNSNFSALLAIFGSLRNALEHHLQYNQTALFQNEEEAIEGKFGYPLDALFRDRSNSTFAQHPLQYTRDLSEL